MQAYFYTRMGIVAARSTVLDELVPKSVLRLSGGLLPVYTGAQIISNWLRIAHYRLETESSIDNGQGILVCLPIGEGAFGLQLAYSYDDEAGFQKIVCIHIHPQFLSQWPPEMLGKDAVFRFDHSAEYELRPDAESMRLMQALLNDATAPDFSGSLNALIQVVQLLRLAVAQVAHPFAACPVPACRFLLYEGEREKVYKAREILDKEFTERITIKTLARRVAMNECYLKKGFKTLLGCTVHEYIASRRLSAARQMLEYEGRTVTEVAALLGYSSISHFSTAFKRSTGLKPCELLH